MKIGSNANASAGVGANVIPKSNGTNLVASKITDDGTTVTVAGTDATTSLAITNGNLVMNGGTAPTFTMNGGNNTGLALQRFGVNWGGFDIATTSTVFRGPPAGGALVFNTNVINRLAIRDGGVIGVASSSPISWMSTTDALSGTADIGLARNAAGVLDITTGTAGTMGSLRAVSAAFGGTAIDPNALVTAASNSSDPSADIYGARFSKTLILTATNARVITGGEFNVSTNANAFTQTGVIRGGLFQVQNQNTSTVSNAYGGDFMLYNVGAGTITAGAGINVTFQNLNAAGVLTAAYGVKVNMPMNNGTYTNTYGIHVGDVTLGTQTNQAYSFYASDVNARNYFAGTTTLDATVTTGAEFVTGIISPSALGAADNPDYAPTGFSSSRILRLTSGGASTTISGLAGGVNGRVITLTNIAANIITLLAASGLSSAANQFSAAAVLAASGAAGSSITLFYDGTSSLWRPM